MSLHIAQPRYRYGSINMDVIAAVARHPQLGDTVFGDELHFIPGGKGANQSLVGFLVLNETELALLTQTPRTDGIDLLISAARSLQAVPQQNIIVIIGARGRTRGPLYQR